MATNISVGRDMLDIIEATEAYAADHLEDVVQGMTDWMDENVSQNEELVDALSEIQNEYALVSQDLKEAAQKATVVMRSGALGMEFALNFISKIPKTTAGGGRKRVAKSRRKKPARKAQKGGGARMVGGNRFTQALKNWTPNPIKAVRKSWDGLTDKQRSIYKIIGFGTLAVTTIAILLACPYVFGGAVVGAGIIAGMHGLGVGLAAAWPYAITIGPVAGAAAVALARLIRMPESERELKELERIQARAKVLCDKYKKEDLILIGKVVVEGDMEDDEDFDQIVPSASPNLTGYRHVAFGSNVKYGGSAGTSRGSSKSSMGRITLPSAKRSSTVASRSPRTTASKSSKASNVSNVSNVTKSSMALVPIVTRARSSQRTAAKKAANKSTP